MRHNRERHGVSKGKRLYPAVHVSRLLKIPLSRILQWVYKGIIKPTKLPTLSCPVTYFDRTCYNGVEICIAEELTSLGLGEETIKKIVHQYKAAEKKRSIDTDAWEIELNPRVRITLNVHSIIINTLPTLKSKMPL